ncbi:MAG: hypothetical protein L3J88_04500 [Gammaproteobacteria bacterium]|nr:hypothetical protein [Gammaproteobacteria bacterium]
MKRAVDAIARVVTLSPDGVAWRWRGEGGKRPWLAGTAVEQMRVVLASIISVRSWPRGSGSMIGGSAAPFHGCGMERAFDYRVGGM